MLSDRDIIEGFLQRDDGVILAYYKLVCEKATPLLSKYGAVQNDVQDVVQEALAALYVNIQSGRYKKNDSVKILTYTLQICKFQWYNTINKKEYNNTSLEELFHGIEDDQNALEHIEVIERNQQISAALSKLGEKCQLILKKFYWEGMSMEDIAAELGMKTNSVKNGKYRCMQKLKTIIQDSTNLGPNE